MSRGYCASHFYKFSSVSLTNGRIDIHHVQLQEYRKFLPQEQGAFQELRSLRRGSKHIFALRNKWKAGTVKPSEAPITAHRNAECLRELCVLAGQLDATFEHKNSAQSIEEWRAVKDELLRKFEEQVAIVTEASRSGPLSLPAVDAREKLEAIRRYTRREVAEASRQPSQEEIERPVDARERIEARRAARQEAIRQPDQEGQAEPAIRHEALGAKPKRENPWASEASYTTERVVKLRVGASGGTEVTYQKASTDPDILELQKEANLALLRLETAKRLKEEAEIANRTRQAQEKRRKEELDERKKRLKQAHEDRKAYEQSAQFLQTEKDRDLVETLVVNEEAQKKSWLARRQEVLNEVIENIDRITRKFPDVKIEELARTREDLQQLIRTQTEVVVTTIAHVESATLKFELYKSLPTTELDVPDYYNFTPKVDVQAWVNKLTEAVRQAATKFAAEIESAEKKRAQRYLSLLHEVQWAKLSLNDLLEKRRTDSETIRKISELRDEIKDKTKQLEACYPVQGLPVPELQVEEPILQPSTEEQAEGAAPTWDVLPALHILKDIDADEVNVNDIGELIIDEEELL